MSINQVLRDQSEALDSLVSDYADQLSVLLQSSSKALLEELKQTLDISSNGEVALSSANVRKLSKVTRTLDTLLKEAGLDRLNASFVESFNGQFEWFDKVLSTINAELPYPLDKPTFTKADMLELKAHQIKSEDLLNSVVEVAGKKLKDQLLLKVNGLSVKDLTEYVENSLAATPGQASAIAETAVSTFYRTITDKGYEHIQEDLPDMELRYHYEGPLDLLNRPFCLKMERQSRAGKTWTRKQILAMDNGQLPNVMLTCGGYRCRHQWVIALDGLEQAVTKRKSKSRRSTIKPSTIDAARVVSQARIKRTTPPKEKVAAARQKAKDKIRSKRGNK